MKYSILCNLVSHLRELRKLFVKGDPSLRLRRSRAEGSAFTALPGPLPFLWSQLRPNHSKGRIPPSAGSGLGSPPHESPGKGLSP
jgi:hypothetical protein